MYLFKLPVRPLYEMLATGRFTTPTDDIIFICCLCLLAVDMRRPNSSEWVKFLANVKSRSRSLYAVAPVALPSVVCLSSVGDARAPYSGRCNFRQYFYAIWYPRRPRKLLRRSSQGNPSVGELNTTGVAKYSDFGPIDGYISETVQDRR